MNKKSTFYSVTNNDLTDNKKNSGITLVALVITVIILLILASIALGMITGQNGLFARANQAGVEYNSSALDEKIRYDSLMDLVNIDETNGGDDNDPVQDSFAYQYGGLATREEVNQDMFTYTILTEPSDTTHGTARVNDINWRYFAEYIPYDEETGDGDYYVIRNWSNVAQQISRLVIPYEVTLDNETYDITELERLIIPSNNDEFDDCPWARREELNADYQTALAVGSSANGTTLQKFSYLIIPSSVTKVVNTHYRWGTCDAIPRDYVIFSPNSQLTEIGGAAFRTNDCFEELIIPNGCTKLDYCAFDCCSSLGKIYIPRSVTEIGDECFVTDATSTWNWDPAINSITIYYEGTEEEWNDIEFGEDIFYYPEYVTILYNQSVSDM